MERGGKCAIIIFVASGSQEQTGKPHMGGEKANMADMDSISAALETLRLARTTQETFNNYMHTGTIDPPKYSTPELVIEGIPKNTDPGSSRKPSGEVHEFEP